jgi:hypothetical protein
MGGEKRQYRRRDVGARFREKVATAPDSRGCLVWLGGTTKTGYGKFGIDYRTVESHRVAWELENGPIPAGSCILHSCDNPRCVNVLHLRLGSHAENMAEAKSRRRHPRGEGHHATSLTDGDVKSILARRSEGLSQQEIGNMHGVSQTTVGRIVRGESWSHVR